MSTRRAAPPSHARSYAPRLRWTHGLAAASPRFWPQRFTTDNDADELHALLKEVKEVGNRHIAIMAHLGHVRELQTEKVRDAIHRLRQEAGVIIRSQSPVMRGINDDAEVWAEKWREEVRLGIVPYYMFMARDTGAQAFFNVPLVRGQRLYADAIRSTSGLCRTARGPSMSCTPGKVEVCGVQNIMGTDAFVLRFLQCRDESWVGKVSSAPRSLSNARDRCARTRRRVPTGCSS